MLQKMKENSNITMLQATLLALPVGFITGIFDTIFGKVLLSITAFRSQYYLFLLPILPIAGVLIVYCYQHFGKNSQQGMGLLFDTAMTGKSEIPKRLIIFSVLATWATHLFGGSAGREGVAVQIGGTVGDIFGRRVKKTELQNTLLFVGMAAGFGGLFRTPIAATFFALEVMVVGKLALQRLIPCMVGATVACYTSYLLGGEHFKVAALMEDAFSVHLIWKLVLLGVIFGLAGLLFSQLLQTGKKYSAKLFPNPYWRIFIGGCLLAALLAVFSHGRYMGLGTNLIETALHGAEIYKQDWLLKLLFTVFTLSLGFQGGEVTPLFAIGAALGAVLAPAFGFPLIFVAALGYVAVFSAATNTYFAPIFIAGEMFGFEIVPYALVVITIAYSLNFNQSIYGKQTTLEKQMETL